MRFANDDPSRPRPARPRAASVAPLADRASFLSDSKTIEVINHANNSEFLCPIAGRGLSITTGAGLLFVPGGLVGNDYHDMKMRINRRRRSASRRVSALRTAPATSCQRPNVICNAERRRRRGMLRHRHGRYVSAGPQRRSCGLSRCLHLMHRVVCAVCPHERATPPRRRGRSTRVSQGADSDPCHYDAIASAASLGADFNDLVFLGRRTRT